MEKQEQGGTVQGIETAEKRKTGKASTVKQFRGTVKNLKESGLVSDKDYEILKGLYEKVVKQFMGETLL